MPIGEDPAAHGHWCAFTDIYHTIPYHTLQTTSCTWPYVVPVGEDPAAHGHWCAFTDLYHTIPYRTPAIKLDW